MKQSNSHLKTVCLPQFNYTVRASDSIDDSIERIETVIRLYKARMRRIILGTCVVVALTIPIYIVCCSIK